MAQLSHLVFGVRDLDAWRRFLTQVLGLVDVGDGCFRMDERAWRVRIQEGPDDLAEVGWEIEGRPTERLLDPAGVPLAINDGPPLADAPFQSPVVRHGFVGDALGLGHLVVTAPDTAASRGFYEGLGFRLSDRIETTVHGFPVDLSFFHINPRHHSLAFGGPQRKRLHHFMVEAASMDEVGLAYDRAIRAGLRITQTLGRHPNDRMFSFYARTPSGFEFEFGWGGREVDPETWEPTTYDHVSEWGHHPPQLVFGRTK